MSRLGRDKLRKRATSFGVDRSQAALLFEAYDLVKEIGQTCDRSATVRPASRTLNRRMVTAAEPVYSTCSSETRRSYASSRTRRTSGYSRTSQTSCWRRPPEMRRPDSLMPRAEDARGKVLGALPRIPARGTPPETPGPLSLPPHVPERSSPSRLRFAAQKRARP